MAISWPWSPRNFQSIKAMNALSAAAKWEGDRTAAQAG